MKLDIPPIVTEAKQRMAEEARKLASCSLPHAFTVPVDRITREEIPARQLFCKWKCAKCGAIVDFDAKHWYELGMQHVDTAGA